MQIVLSKVTVRPSGKDQALSPRSYYFGQLSLHCWFFRARELQGLKERISRQLPHYFQNQPFALPNLREEGWHDQPQLKEFSPGILHNQPPYNYRVQVSGNGL
jgi:hypothetical protein